ncbi:MAG: hypothetical protein ABI759_02890 [Candidatus Solibacter sp.]
MKTVAGVFASAQLAQRAAEVLQQVGIGDVNVLLPGAPEAAVDSVPVSDGEQPGMGAALGGVLGGALGMAGGLGVGSAAAALIVPGVGPVLAFGLAAAALFGAGGAVAGAAAGAELETGTTTGIPADELFVYKDALRRGRAVLFVQAKDEDQAERAQVALSAAGAESIDAAREQHWIGLRGAEREHYQGLGGNFESDEIEYRRGFQAAMAELEPSLPDDRQATNYAFRRGYQRGSEWCRAQREKH